MRRLRMRRSCFVVNVIWLAMNKDAKDLEDLHVTAVSQNGCETKMKHARILTNV